MVIQNDLSTGISIALARETLGDEAERMSDLQISQLMITMQLLVEMAFDLYEKQTFGRIVSRHGN